MNFYTVCGSFSTNYYYKSCEVGGVFSTNYYHKTCPGFSHLCPLYNLRNLFTWPLVSSRWTLKGELISKVLFGVFNFFQKNEQKQVDLRYQGNGRIFSLVFRKNSGYQQVLLKITDHQFPHFFGLPVFALNYPKNIPETTKYISSTRYHNKHNDYESKVYDSEFYTPIFRDISSFFYAFT